MFDINNLTHIDCTGYPYSQKEEEQKTPIQFSWGIKKFGWGTITFFYEDRILKCDNETMSKDMIKQLLCAFVDKAEFIDSNEVATG